ncbi:MAG: tRNA (adenosine(37)-N6)-threonylcarbamoyltransferase complex dimerization subunit type 1 TsaB [Gammaproteobacteria bacterium]|nr:MAG: tRNA (adenosine(37)-N6)-threonylcarbamoyltransferase complex dimerization subunit type 1 TsaB [Gammaproteobacteria bacterium]
MKALAFETATEACSVALLSDGETIELHEIVPRKHTERLLPMVEQLLSEAEISLNQLDFLTFGRGPGAFTGVRIAASAAQGMAFGADLPVVPVSTLAVLAQNAYEQTNATTILSCIDARMSEVYWSVYKPALNGVVEIYQEEEVVAPTDICITNDLSDNIAAVGSGWLTYKDELTAMCSKFIQTYIDDIYPHANQLMKLAISEFEKGNAVSPELALPVYLRDDVAKKSTKPPVC